LQRRRRDAPIIVIRRSIFRLPSLFTLSPKRLPRLHAADITFHAMPTH